MKQFALFSGSVLVTIAAALVQAVIAVPGAQLVMLG